MTQIISTLAEISEGYDAVFCDLWGCVHDGIRAYPAANAALQAYRAQGGKVVLLTNSPRPKASVAAQIKGLGVPDDAWDEIVTSGDAAQFALVSGAVGQKVFHIGSPKDLPFFEMISGDLPQTSVERVPLSNAQGIVCTGLFDDMPDPEAYRGQLMLAREEGLKMLCANPDIIVDRGDHREYCAGALAALYEEIGGEALYFGKPHPPIYDLARRRLAAITPEIAPERILCIGDGIGTDIAGANGEGLDAIFVTGGLAASEFGADVEQPDQALLDRWLEAKQAVSRFAMGRLR